MRKQWEKEDIAQVIVKMHKDERDEWFTFASEQGMTLSNLLRKAVREQMDRCRVAKADADRFAAIRGIIEGDRGR